MMEKWRCSRIPHTKTVAELSEFFRLVCFAFQFKLCPYSMSSRCDRIERRSTVYWLRMIGNRNELRIEFMTVSICRNIFIYVYNMCSVCIYVYSIEKRQPPRLLFIVFAAHLVVLEIENTVASIHAV